MHLTWRFCCVALAANCLMLGLLGQAVAGDGTTETSPRTAVSAQQRDPQRLQELQARIEALQKQLESLQREMEEVRLYIEEQAQETIPVIQTNLAEALRFRPANYIQFQWFDSQENRTNEGFQLRRFRISQNRLPHVRRACRVGRNSAGIRTPRAPRDRGLHSRTVWVILLQR
jgi:TolA-binding protein